MITEIFLNEFIESTVSETFEKIGFIEIVSCEEQFKMDRDVLTTQLKVDKPRGFTFLLKTDIGLLEEIAANIFGATERAFTDEIKQDVLAEILNTISGRIMQHVTPTGEVFDLGVPELNIVKETSYNNVVKYVFKTSEDQKVLFIILYNRITDKQGE